MESSPQQIQQDINSGKAFALYRLPGTNNFCFTSGETKEFRDYSFMDRSGFVFSPFEVRADLPVCFIDSNQREELSSKDLEQLNFDSVQLRAKEDFDENDYEDNYDTYFIKINTLIEALKEGRAQKAILSRIHKSDFPFTDYSRLLVELAEKYDHAFVYMIHIPGKETWIGASPETLAEVGDNTLKTVSVAATKKYDNDREWTDKEVEEQKLVTDFIEDIFKNENLNYSVSNPTDYRAGNVVHLKTSFEVCSQVLNSKIKTIISELHPTPAVCGLPKSEAKLLISEIERHDRRYYAGFLGPIGMNNDSHLFVNIRCMRLLEGKQLLYLGGGITAKSVPEHEWKETIIKSHTLLDVLTNIS